tara:strand:+ start:185 stop:547 length:363 start_codon:yes stop_codon:yes gene_type:complete
MSAKLKTQIISGMAFGSLLVPALALAQGGAKDAAGLIGLIATLVGQALPVLIGVAILFFIWGVVRFLLAGDNEDTRKAARNMIIWGIISIFVIVSVWGLVNLLGTTFGLTNTPPPVPGLP